MGVRLNKPSYGAVAVTIIIIYLGFSIILSSSGLISNPIIIFSGFLLTLGVWTVIYGFLLVEDGGFYVGNGSILILLSASLITFLLTSSIGYSLGIFLICLGLLALIYIFKG